MDLHARWHIAYPRWFRTSASSDINMLPLISGPPRRGPQWVNISVLQQLPCTCLYFRHGNWQTQNSLNGSHGFQKQLGIWGIWGFCAWLGAPWRVMNFKGQPCKFGNSGLSRANQLGDGLASQIWKGCWLFLLSYFIFFSVIRPDIKQIWSWQSCSRSRKQDGEPKSAQKVKCIPKAIHYLSGCHPYLLQNFSIKHLHDLKEIILHYSNK